MTWGIWLGLLRLGWVLPLPWPDQLILHGPLMIGGFLGTLIGLERAIGLARPWAYLAPVCSASGGLFLMFGPPGPVGPLLITVASAVVAVVFVSVIRRNATLFTATMLGGALAWALGNAQWLAGAAIHRVVFWWVTFVVLTIAGERLELNRVLRPALRVRVLFALSTFVIMTGALVMPAAPVTGTRVTGAGLVALAWWLAQYDVARRTVHQSGLARFMAVCLISGYAWLGAAGLLLMITVAAPPGPAYDAILHAIFLGFVVSMIFGHAPIVFPAITGIPLPHRPAAYVPLIVLHASVMVRLTGDLVDVLGRLRAWGGLLNALAIVLFIASTGRSLVTARRHALRARTAA
jgi:hypothetical protein